MPETGGLEGKEGEGVLRKGVRKCEGGGGGGTGGKFIKRVKIGGKGSVREREVCRWKRKSRRER